MKNNPTSSRAKYARRVKARKFKSTDVPLTQLYREIDQGFRRVFSKRGIEPKISGF